MISPLLTDLYQLTMAYGYWQLKMHEREAVFQLIFRSAPFSGEYALACGLQTVAEFIENWHFSEDDLAYLGSLKTVTGEILFSKPFLDYLKDLRLSVDIDAIPEGELVFPHEPLIRVKGPLLQVQLLESTLLNIINFQTLIATKAARVCEAAGDDPVLEFGLRRAQGPDGALSASRAAFIGGCTATSNVLAGKQFGIPVRGTHAHSWVSAFASELEAFEAYAEVMPGNCVLLVDTYDTLQGVENAIQIGKKLREKGRELRGIRLDSGNLAVLSIQARALLDAAGFEKTIIVASNALDEDSIRALKSQKAAISTWGIGTSLVTSYDQPALNGVYKLSALRDEKGVWDYKIKLSEQISKISNPGIHQVRRFYENGKMIGDILYDLESDIPEGPSAHSLLNTKEEKHFENNLKYRDLLQAVFRKGQLVQALPKIQDLQAQTKESLKLWALSFKKTLYFVGLETGLYELKQKLISERGKNS